MAYHKALYTQLCDCDLLIEITIVILLNNLLFYLILSSRPIGGLFIALLFGLGGISNYYLFSYHRVFDASIMIDLLSVESNLIWEYLDFKILIIFSLSAALGYYLVKLKLFKNSISLILYKILFWFNIFLLIFSIICSLVFRNHNPQKVIISYLPYNMFYSGYYFIHNYLPNIQKSKNKTDLTKKYQLSFTSDPDEPLLIALIIGESMRGDLISLNGHDVKNMPLLANIPNIISFPDATSSSTATRISLPYMLTRAIAPNFDQALEEQSIISVFKSLGFKTSWIGNQGAFGIYETTYASIVMEADYVLLQPQIKKLYSNNKVYDEYLLDPIKRRIAEVSGNHFIVIHLLGSHWAFKERYPEKFEDRFLPSCKKSSPCECSSEELTNGYYNTIAYTDFVLFKIINVLNQYNSFVIYSSDHGFSLGEDGIYGNAYLEEPFPQAQTNIAMFSWSSDRFLEQYKANYNQLINKKYSPINHSMIFHSLLGCINVKSDIINPTLNLCH